MRLSDLACHICVLTVRLKAPSLIELHTSYSILWLKIREPFWFQGFGFCNLSMSPGSHTQPCHDQLLDAQQARKSNAPNEISCSYLIEYPFGDIDIPSHFRTWFGTRCRPKMPTLEGPDNRMTAQVIGWIYHDQAGSAAWKQSFLEVSVCLAVPFIAEKFEMIWSVLFLTRCFWNKDLVAISNSNQPITNPAVRHTFLQARCSLPHGSFAHGRCGSHWPFHRTLAAVRAPSLHQFRLWGGCFCHHRCWRGHTGHFKVWFWPV